MRKSLIGVAVGGLTATVALGAAAYAATYTVEVAGTQMNASHPFYASDVNGISFSVKNPAGTTTLMSCAHVNAEGEAYSGSPIDPIATIKPVTLVNAPDIAPTPGKPYAATQWKDCVGPFGLAMSVDQLNEWEVHGESTDVTSAQTDVIHGYISGPDNEPLEAQVWATESGKGNDSCAFTVAGYAKASFDEATQTLTVEEDTFNSLEIVGATGDCIGLVPVGSTANFEGSFKVGADDSGNTKGNITVPLPINVISSP